MVFKFGTSGWRGIIADDFTFANAHRVTRAICRCLQTTGAVQNAPVIVGYDTRFLSERFAAQGAKEIALAALKVLAGRLGLCAALVETLSLRAVGQRLACLLLAEARAKGERTASGIHLKIEMTHAQIAARIGIMREVVSRAFTRLHSDGLIIVEERSSDNSKRTGTGDVCGCGMKFRDCLGGTLQH